MPNGNMHCHVLILNQGSVEHGRWIRRELREFGYNVQEFIDPEKLEYAISTLEKSCSKVLLPVSIRDHLWCATTRERLHDAGIKFVVDEAERIETFSNKVSCYKMIEARTLLDPINYPAFRLITGVETCGDVRQHVDLENFWVKGRDKERFPPFLKWLPEPPHTAKMFNPNYEYLAQEHVQGPIHGYFALAKNGELYEEFMHKRLRDIPLAGGSCCYAESYDDEVLRKIGRDFLRRSRWTGFVMLEFKRDEKDGTYRLIEINPKLWGTYALSSVSGCHFAQRYIQLALGELDVAGNSTYESSVRVYYPFREAALLDPMHSRMNRLRNIISSSWVTNFNVNGDKIIKYGLFGILMAFFKKLANKLGK